MATAPPEDEPLEALRAGELADAQTFRAFMTLGKLERPLADNVDSFAASRTERLPHQFKPVRDAITSDSFTRSSAAPRTTVSTAPSGARRGG